MQLRLVVRSLVSSRNMHLALILIGAFLPMGQANAAVVRWIGGNGYWDVAANWTKLPAAGDNVVDNRSGTVITHRRGNDAVGSLTMSTGTALIMTGGSLTVTNGITLASGSVFDLQGGTLRKATVGDSNLFAGGNSAPSGLGGVTIKAGITGKKGGIVTIENGLTPIDREFLFSGGSKLIFDGNQTPIYGNFRLDSNATFELSPGTALTAILDTLSLELPSIYPIRFNRIIS
jgi:hypothetical protein